MSIAEARGSGGQNSLFFLVLLVKRGTMSESQVLRKDQLETSLFNERKLIGAGELKEDNPLDLSEPFRELCEACRRGDLKACQEKITEGVNINGRDLFDCTPLILVSEAPPFILPACRGFSTSGSVSSLSMLSARLESGINSFTFAPWLRQI